MKKIKILFTVLFLVLGLTSWAVADLYTDPFTQVLTKARFYAVDDFGTTGTSGSVTLSNITIAAGYTPQYSFDGTSWSSIAPFGTFTVSPVNQSRLIYFQLHPASGSDLTNATLNFGGKQFPQDPGSSLFHRVLINFSAGKFEVITAAGNDHVSPVPIPATVWLLGAGLVGIGLIRKRIHK